MKERVVFNPQVAHELIKMGFIMLKKRADYKNPEFEVYIFEDTFQFRKALNEIINR